MMIIITITIIAGAVAITPEDPVANSSPPTSGYDRALFIRRDRRLQRLLRMEWWNERAIHLALLVAVMQHGRRHTMIIMVRRAGHDRGKYRTVQERL